MINQSNQANLRFRQALIQRLQGLLYSLEIGQLACVLQYLGVAHHSFFVYNKGGAFRNTALVVRENLVDGIIRCRGFLIKIAQQVEVQVLVGLKAVQRLEGVYRDTINRGIQPVIHFQVVAHRAQLFGTHAGKGQWKEQEYYVLTLLFAEGHLILPGIAERKIGGLLAGLYRHLLNVWGKDNGHQTDSKMKKLQAL